jgi:hypothetical protein
MTMKTIQIVRIALLASAFALTGALAAVDPQLDAAMSMDGLVPFKTKDLDLAYTRPGATLSAYKKVMLDPVEVAFHKDWNPERTGSRLKLSATERENIRTGVAKVVEEEFARTLSAKNAYPIVKEAGPDVLRVRVKIMNLYANAPDTAAAGRSRTFVVSAGEMTLLMELYDSETGAILARIVDRQEARSTGQMQLSNSVTNAGEAAQIANGWARLLKKGLDKAREAPKGEPAKK